MINRRKFLKAAAGGVIISAAGNGVSPLMANPSAKEDKNGVANVALVKTSDRGTGIRKAVEILGVNPVKGQDVLLKPNFNTSDPFPGSTHNDTLVHLILHLKRMGAKSITIGERSGPPNTANVLKEKGIYDLCKEYGVGLINFEELPASGWVKVKPEGSHWLNGFEVAKPVLDSKCTVSTCCLKTHGYGGGFTMSLKLSVGITRKKNMKELHTSFLSMKKMIAEINQVYAPSLIVMDAIEAFTDGGPMTGTRKRADLIVAGADRIAIDAVGLAILKHLGSNDGIMARKIFEQEQIVRAVDLGIGVSSPDRINILTGDPESKQIGSRLREILLKG
ncbi:MAG TPA: DUF362 domain-containing protein [Thermodesulfovibrionales bacterium]|nr:DUF362 domain-containing protein [Thermodesulfovibrionales bacterium]